jgi:glycerol-3-phosphate acyltransferase PlsX
MLDQFALLGSVYFEATTGKKAPRVGLMNIGEEEQKGSILTLATHALLKENKKINSLHTLVPSSLRMLSLLTI